MAGRVYALWTTRNGQHQWGGPYRSLVAAQSARPGGHHPAESGEEVIFVRPTSPSVEAAGRKVLAAYQKFLDDGGSDAPEGLRLALTDLQLALGQ